MALRIVWLCTVLLLAISSLHAAEESVAQAGGPEALEKMLPDLHLLEPLWRSAAVHRESVLFVQDSAERFASAKLLFKPEKIWAIRSADGLRIFELGKDCQLAADGDKLVLSSDSRIPRLQAADLFPVKGAERSIPQKAGDPERSVLFDNGHWFHDQQVEVTYSHAAAPWPEPTPTFAGNTLPKTLAKLRSGAKITLAVSGDSISQGYNASAYSKAPPWMPPYPDLVAAQLRKSYGAEVVLHNRAIGGWNVPRGLTDLEALLATRPDLVIIAYGMNDVGGRNPDAFRQGVAAMLERIHQSNADIEVILVTPMLGNADWVHTPREMFTKYRQVLASLSVPGVGLADVTSVWQLLLQRKREVDLTGNGVNHPNDFGHRLYAQIILALLIEPQPESASEAKP